MIIVKCFRLLVSRVAWATACFYLIFQCLTMTMFQPWHLELILRPVKLSELNYWSNKLIIAHTIANDQSEQIQFSTNSIKSNTMMMVSLYSKISSDFQVYYFPKRHNNVNMGPWNASEFSPHKKKSLWFDCCLPPGLT